MNEEKKIARAIQDAHRHHNESYDENLGDCRLEVEECFRTACENNGLSPGIWKLLAFANHWHNDIQDWANDVLKG